MVKSFAEIALRDEAATHALAGKAARLLCAGDVLLLQGDLGAGKTTFARAAIRLLMGYEVEVPSPTFTLVQVYETPDFPLWHFDLYRLSRAEEIYEIGWEDAMTDGAALVEWPERLGSLTPRDALTLRFAFAGQARSVTLAGPDSWMKRWEKAA